MTTRAGVKGLSVSNRTPLLEGGKTPLKGESALKGDEPLKNLSLKSLSSYLRREGLNSYSREQLDELMKAAPPMTGAWPDDATTQELIAAYQRITGSTLPPKAVRFLTSSHRVHGEDTIPLLEELWRLSPTRTNLLADLRCNPPRLRLVEDVTPSAPGSEVSTAETPWLDTGSGREARAMWGDKLPDALDTAAYHRDLDRRNRVPAGTHSAESAATVDGIYETLPYGPDESPSFDPKSKTRYDRVCASCGHEHPRGTCLRACERCAA
jgi:hypothetical protein